MSNAYDPRAVPVLGTCADCPQLSSELLTADGLRAFFRTEHPADPDDGVYAALAGPPPRQAAVLVPVVLHPRPTLLLTQRTSHLRKHAGQIAFPGGKMDEGDTNAVAAALREAQEEVGLAPHRVEVLGALPRHRMNAFYGVTPVVGLVPPDVVWQANPHEVAEVFEVPLDFLMNPANHRRHAYEVDGRVREWFSMPYQDGQGERFIWGATAAMLHGFYRLLAGSL